MGTKVPLQGPAKGDSGGPLLQKRDDKTFVVGVCSYGNDKEEAKQLNAPHVYMNVSYFLDWIIERLNN